MTSLEEMKRELHEKFERLKGKKSNPGSPEELENCLSIRLTEEKDIEISFKDLPECSAVKDEYREILRAALVGGETIYKTLREE